MFQFTLPRGERPVEARVVVGAVLVSIHAPAWGATTSARMFTRGAMFQFTLPRGERHARTPRVGLVDPFQFTLPRGERLGRYCCLLGALPVSIHAPAWGATK